MYCASVIAVIASVLAVRTNRPTDWSASLAADDFCFEVLSI